MSTSEVSGKPDEMLGGGVGEGKLLMDWHPIQGGGGSIINTPSCSCYSWMDYLA